MGNTVPGTVTKMLTLLPVLVAVYFYDFPRFASALLSARVLPFFVLTISLFLLGVFLKRKILVVRLEVSRVSFGWGLLLLALAVILYIYGSFSSQLIWFHYESLYVLVLAYVALRVGGGILRALSPLLVILAFSMVPAGIFPDTLQQGALILFSGDIVFGSFLVFVGMRASKAVIPLGMVVLATAAWCASIVMPAVALYLVPLVPLPLVLFAVPSVRRFATLKPGSGIGAAACPEHRILPSGFCSVCGSKLAAPKLGENVGIWGLLAVLAVAALLLFPTVPALAIVGGVPNTASYSPNGVSHTLLPQTPGGWQVNSTTLDPKGSNAYAVTRVYVPQYHPETENYTVDFELSTLSVPTTNGPFGVEVAGWNISSNVFTTFGPFQGYLTTYVAAGSVMLAYHGVTQMLFVNGSSFAQYYVGLGFVREFKNSNASSDTTQFMADLNTLWLPSVTKDASYSEWTVFLLTMYDDSEAVSALALLASSMAIIGWVAYRARSFDDRLDRFLTVAVAQPENNYSCVSNLLGRRHHAGTAEELAAARGSTSGELQVLCTSLDELEQQGLVKTALVERGSDIVSVWRTVV